MFSVVVWLPRPVTPTYCRICNMTGARKMLRGVVERTPAVQKPTKYNAVSLEYQSEVLAIQLQTSSTKVVWWSSQVRRAQWKRYWDPQLNVFKGNSQACGALRCWVRNIVREHQCQMQSEKIGKIQNPKRPAPYVMQITRKLISWNNNEQVAAGRQWAGFAEITGVDVD